MAEVPSLAISHHGPDNFPKIVIVVLRALLRTAVYFEISAAALLKLGNRKDGYEEAECLCSDHLKCWKHQLKDVSEIGEVRAEEGESSERSILSYPLPPSPGTPTISFRLPWQ
ncbi:hypothetical protein CRG98_011486 [Punica granatum]|uniref:Uncharacterized protein n=1 Tax=Punica granatum TaxID=22663 RepID=A0A2I0KHU7_PUNGR|nr:hypothetical protein CRG98_011486 [Punica granatum]